MITRDNLPNSNLKVRTRVCKNQNKGCFYILNPFKYISQDLKSRKDKNKEEANFLPRDNFEEQLLFGYDRNTEGESSTSQQVFNYQDEIQCRETLGSNNPLIKELSKVSNIEQLKEQLKREEQERSPTPEYLQSETEYQSESGGGSTPLNKQNNQLLPNLNNNSLNNMIFDANIANVLTLALTNLNTTLAVGEEERKTVNYSTFSKRGEEDINDFILELEKTFAVNRVLIN